MMFDFTNYTYSGMLSIVAAVFGIAYPQINASIERIDDKYGSSLLTTRLKNEKAFTIFNVLLVVNLIIAVVNPFLLDQSKYCYIYIAIQTIATIFLIGCFFHLFEIIRMYNDAETLHVNIWNDYKKVVGKSSEKASVHFMEWVDLISYILRSTNRNAARNVYDKWVEYITEFHKGHIGTKVRYDNYAYDGITKINENLCKLCYEPMSINNGNAFLTALLYPDGFISEDTYTILWTNLRLQIFYGKDEWVMDYWEQASQKYDLYMDNVSTYTINSLTNTNFTEEEAKQHNEERKRFLEFHVMFCAMLLQQGKYSLLKRILSFTQSQPQVYPLVPSTLTECIEMLSYLNGIYTNYPFLLDRRYPMPQLKGITSGKILGAANTYIALLTYRLYALPYYPFGVGYVFSLPAAPQNSMDILKEKDNIDALKFCIRKIESKKDYLKCIDFVDISAAISNINRVYKEKVKCLDCYINDYISRLNEKDKDLRVNQEYDKDIVENLKKDIYNEISSELDKYHLFLKGQISDNSKGYIIDASVCQLYPNQAFVDKPSVSYVDIDTNMSDGVKYKFSHFFATTFLVRATPQLNIASQDLFEAFEKLKLNDNFIIISFGVYWDYHIGKNNNFMKTNDIEYSYNNICIYNYKCRSKGLSDYIFVLEKNYLPYLKFIKPNKDWIDKYHLEIIEDQYNIGLGLQKIVKNKSLLTEDELKNIDGDPNELSLFSCIVLANIYWKPNSKMMCIKNMHFGVNNGNTEQVEKIKPFMSYFTVC